MSNPKIQAVLARMGLGSRRGIEQWIGEGRIRVNGQLAKVGQRVGPEDVLTLDGKEISLVFDTPETQVLIYYKKVGEICSRREGDFPTVFESLPPARFGKWINIGRLDLNTEGLLVFTNDGTLAHRLMHPKFDIERHYEVRVFGVVTEEAIAQLHEGIMSEGELLKAEKITPKKPLSREHQNQWFHVVLKEGKNREIRRLFQSINCQVSRLMRVQYGPIKLPTHLKPGQYKYLTASEVATFPVSG